MTALDRFAHAVKESDSRHEADLREFISRGLEDVFEDVGGLTSTTLATAADIIFQKSEGKFVYTAVVVGELENWYSEEEEPAAFSIDGLLKKLESLPEGIDDCYRKTFQKLHTFMGSELGHNFLLLMVSSRELLKDVEVRYLLSMEAVSDEKRSENLVKSTEVVFPLRERRIDYIVNIYV